MSKKEKTVAVIGLGYVGLPLAVNFNAHFDVIGFDVKVSRLEELKQGIDRNREVSPESLRASDINFTDSLEVLKNANFFIVAVPTPVDSDHQPDLNMVFGATKTVGKVLKSGDYVVYESTVYPGLTEEECIPLLEKTSGLKSGKDFKVAYSPERINPGDNQHKLESIVKIVSAQDEESLNEVASVYQKVLKHPVYRAPSIKVAEAAKVIENTQRDLNIALVNELAQIFDRMGIDSNQVIDAAATKWNFQAFRPGLVGGHCIGVDPYYLTYKAKQLGFDPKVILAGRSTNNFMPTFIVERTLSLLREQAQPGRPKISILGITFKENCPDIRNSLVRDMIASFKNQNCDVEICDPWAMADETEEEFGIPLTPAERLSPADAVVVAVAHRDFFSWNESRWASLLKRPGLLMDVKNVLDRKIFAANHLQEIKLWKL